MFQTDIPYEICRCLAGQRFQFTVETGTAHIQERAQYVHCEIGIIHVLLDMSLYIRHEFPVETIVDKSAHLRSSKGLWAE